jgi:excisionase family DNA binding protein
MDNLSWRLSQTISDTFRHAETRAQNQEFRLENRGLKLKSCSSKDHLESSVSSLREKIHPTEFLARNHRERRWSGECALKERQSMLLTVEEVARDHLKVSRATVYRLIRAGELRSSKVLGCTRISVQELERFENMIGGVL